MIFRHLRPMIFAGLACLTLSAAPARAALIQDFTFFSEGQVTASGTITFAESGIDKAFTLDISGSAWGNDFDFTDATGTGTLIDWTITEWIGISLSVNAIDPIINIFTSSNPAGLRFSCIENTINRTVCGGDQNDSVKFETTSFTPRHDIPEPMGLVLFATGLVLLVGFRRRRRNALPRC